MTDNLVVELSITQVCRSVGVSEAVVHEVVAHGIVEPRGELPETWVFDARMVAVTNKAVRLRRELDIDWAGVAVALELMDRLEELGTENAHLRQQLSRFIQE